MLTKKQARLFFVGGTVFFGGIFLSPHRPLPRPHPRAANSDLMTESVVREKGFWDSSHCMGCHTILGEGAYVPALRQAKAMLAAAPAERRLVLLIRGGKPTDYDRYAGRYGVADVRQAIREAHRLDIETHALAVDAVARDDLPALFGEGGWHILPKPDELVRVLTLVYGRLTAR